MNVANWDRSVRVVGGAALIALGAFSFSGVAAGVSIAAGLIFVVTGTIGWCPIYAALRIRTRSAKALG